MPLLTDEESALDPYKVLDLEPGATDKEITKAYRKKSLLYHPDKSKAEEAPARLREVHLSLEILNDPAKRTYVDTRLETDRRRKEKYAQSDKKRKEMIDALELREEEAKKAKIDQARRRREEAAEEEIMDAGKRMLEEAQRRAASTAKTASRAVPETPLPTTSTATNTATTSTQPPITPIDLTLIIQFPSSSSMSDGLHDRLTSLYGPVNHVFIKEPPGDEGKKKKKGRKAIVEFKEGNWGGCWACWRDLDGGMREGWEGVKVKWAGGSTPDWVAWSETYRPIPRPAPESPTARMNDRPESNTNANTNINTNTLPTFNSAPNFGSTTMSDLLASHSQSRTDQVNKKKREDEFESMTLLKMRQMERERLIEEIRREEEA